MIVVAGIPLLTLATLTIQHALNVTQLLSDLTRKAAGMYYEERWIDGKFCWRTSPNGAWTAYTANELAHRYQAELQRAHDLQRALDAEREKVKRLSTCGTDHSTP